jgi:hypothetical protein
MVSIHENQTSSLVDLSPNHKHISVKWVYKLKSGLLGTPSKHKFYFVAHGD